MTTVAGERTTRTAAGRLTPMTREPFVRAVVAPWMVTRVLGVLVVVGFGARNRQLRLGHLLTWDSQWYQMIADDGYGPKPVHWPPGHEGWTKLPFFPLFPGLWRGLVTLGVPHLPAAILIESGATLVAMWGVWRLAQTHTTERAARQAVWYVGLLPGALTFVMGYADAIYLAGTVWAFLLVTRKRLLPAALAAAVATAARPNGILVIVSLTLLILAVRERRLASRLRDVVVVALPSVLFFAGWCTFLGLWMGDPFAFLTAKRAWDETSLASFVSHPANLIAASNLAVGAGALTLYASRWRKQPAAWSVHALLAVLPSLGFGVVGLIRYTSQCFVTPIALAATTARSRRVAAVMLATTTCLLIVYGYLVMRRGYVP